MGKNKNRTLEWIGIGVLGIGAITLMAGIRFGFTIVAGGIILHLINHKINGDD